MTQALELHVPFLERPFPDDLAISKWVCKQAPLAAVRAVEAENTATAARLATTRPRLMLRCVQCLILQPYFLWARWASRWSSTRTPPLPLSAANFLAVVSRRSMRRPDLNAPSR